MEYRREVLTKEIGESLKLICVGISERYEVQFVEIGYESDHIHFLVQSVPSISVSKLVTMIKSLSSWELFKAYLEIKRILWRGNLWTSGYYANTVGQYGNKDVILPHKYLKYNYLIEKGTHFMTLNQSEKIEKIILENLA